MRLLEQDGWVLVTSKGRHRQYKHPSKMGRVTVPGKLSDDEATGTESSILSTGETIAEVGTNIGEAIALHLVGMREDGLDIPDPSSQVDYVDVGVNTRPCGATEHCECVMPAFSLSSHPIHLGFGAAASIEPAFSGSMDWYAQYADRHAADGAKGRLVSLHTFDKPWAMWEMHPNGAEVVLCTAGSITLVQELPNGSTVKTELRSGQYAINAPGVWHTADVDGEATALFITAGMGTEHRPRVPQA